MVSGPVGLVSSGTVTQSECPVAKGRGHDPSCLIDAPETSQGASGKWSTTILKRLIQRKSISLNPQVKDRYGRTVAEIYVGNRNINLQMVQVGAAYVYRQYLKQCDRDSYLRAEDAANKKGLGVWGPYNQPKSLGSTAVHVDADMIRLILPLSLGLVVCPRPCSSRCFINGKASNGYYWQKTSTSSGSIKYNCRSTSQASSKSIRCAKTLVLQSL